MIFQPSKRLKESYQDAVEERERALAIEQRRLEEQTRRERVARQVQRAGALAVKNSLHISSTDNGIRGENLRFMTGWAQISSDVSEGTAVEVKLVATGTRRKRLLAKPEADTIQLYTRMASIDGEIHSDREDYTVGFGIGYGRPPRIVLPPNGSEVGMEQSGVEVQPGTEAWSEIDYVLEQLESSEFKS